jgi:thiol-disulfide isomerase/thioredoxin
LAFLLALSFLNCSKPDVPLKARPSAASASASTSVPAASSAVASPAPSSRELGLKQVSAELLLANIRAAQAKATVVNAWASWCGPCREELPMLDALSKNLRRQGVEVMLVSVDEPEDHGKAEAFLRSFEIKLPAFIATRPLGPFKEGLNPRWPGMLPATFLFDSVGKLRYFWGGPVREEEILGVVEGLLAGKAIDGESDFTLAPGKVEP